MMRRILSENFEKYPEDVVQQIKVHFPNRIENTMQKWKRDIMRGQFDL